MSGDAFLLRHGITVLDDYRCYHYALALYTLYLIQAMELADDVEDGIYFEMGDAEILLDNLKAAQDTLQQYRDKIKIPCFNYDVAERISLKGCRLEHGKIIGNKEDAIKIARMWIQDYQNGEGNPFAFEVGIYILFLLHEEVDYSFLTKED